MKQDDFCHFRILKKKAGANLVMYVVYEKICIGNVTSCKAEVIQD
jgi:hypothetical protein